MTTCIDRGATQCAWIRILRFVGGNTGIGLVLAAALSACGGGGDNVDGLTLATSAGPVPTTGSAQAASTALSPARQSMSTEELIDNFESGMDKWSNWGNAQVVDGAGVAGSRAMRVGTGAGGAGYNVWEVMAGSTYRITAQARVSDASEILFIGINIVTPEGVVVAKQMASISSTTYSLVSMEVKVPDSGAYGADVFVWKNAGSGYGFVDNVTFSQVNVTAPPPPPPPSTNLMSNPGFEAGMTSWVNWANAVVVDGAGMAASHALRVGTAAGGAAQDVAGIVPGAEYQLTVQARMSVPGEVSYIGLNMLDASGNVVAQRLTEVRDTTFHTVSVQLTAPANAVKAVVYVWKNASSGYVFVDDVVLTIAGAAPPPPPPPQPPPTLTNLLSNPGFESGMTGWVDWTTAVVIQGAGRSVGSSGLRIGTTAGGAAQQVSGIVGGAEYQLVAQVRVTNPGDPAYLGINMLDAAGNVVAQRVYEFMDTMYETASVRLTAPANAVSAVVYVWKNASSGYALADDFFFGRVGQSTPPPSENNLVQNSGFENQLANWEGDGGTAVTDPASGTYAANVGPERGGISQNLTLVPGQTYRLSAQVKTIGVVGPGIWDPNGVSVFFRNASGGPGFYALPLPVVSGSYSTSRIDFTVPAGTTVTQLYLWMEGDGGSIHVDNISVTPL